MAQWTRHMRIYWVAVLVFTAVFLFRYAYWTNDRVPTIVKEPFTDVNTTILAPVAPVASIPEPNPEPEDSDAVETVCGRTIKWPDIIPPWSYFKNRFARMREEFQQASYELRDILKKQNTQEFSNICEKQIHVYVGHVLHLGMNGEQGGPQGDIMQWSDVIQALYFLGAKVTVHHDYTHVTANNVDQVWMDYYSSERTLSLFDEKCIVRFIDAYGTEEKYNSGGSGYFCCKKLPNVKQYMTFTPDRSPQNSFLGFAVPNENRFRTGAARLEPFNKTDMHAVVWGKSKSYINGKADYLQALASVMKVHLTMRDLEEDHPFGNENITNHGFLTTDQYNEILDKALFFIGMDQPLFGHGAIEATMKGLIYFNPLFNPAWNRNHPALQGKPTDQTWTSQHPFMEKLDSKWVVNVEDKNSIVLKVEEMREKFSTDKNFYKQIKYGFIPEEYTTLSFLKRVYDLAIKTDFCK